MGPRWARPVEPVGVMPAEGASGVITVESVSKAYGPVAALAGADDCLDVVPTARLVVVAERLREVDAARPGLRARKSRTPGRSTRRAGDADAPARRAAAVAERGGQRRARAARRRARPAPRRAPPRGRTSSRSASRASRRARPAELSGGMRQRVAFLRTLLAGTPVLCLDEPFGALDALTRVQMQDWLAGHAAAEPRTVLLVTHDVEEAIVLADRVVLLSDGRDGCWRRSRRPPAPAPARRPRGRRSRRQRARRPGGRAADVRARLLVVAARRRGRRSCAAATRRPADPAAPTSGRRALWSTTADCSCPTWGPPRSRPCWACCRRPRGRAIAIAMHRWAARRAGALPARGRLAGAADPRARRAADAAAGLRARARRS